MAYDSKIQWWHIVPGAMVALPAVLRQSFFQSNIVITLLIILICGAGIHLFFRLYYYIIVKAVPRKSIAFIDYKLKRELKRRDFKPRDTDRAFTFFLESQDSWELKQLKKYNQLMNFIGCIIIACGFGIIQILTQETSFLMRYYVMFTVFAVLNFTVMWDQVNEYEKLTALVNFDTMVKEIKKKKLLWI